MKILYSSFKSFFKSHTNTSLFFLFLIHLCLTWPGYMSSDTMVQYQMALSGIYNDHHPFIMSFIWRFLNKIHEGPGLLLVLNLMLFYGSIFNFMKSLPQEKHLFLFIPFIPQVFVFSFCIWKDIACAYSFLHVASFLTYQMSLKNNSKINWMNFKGIIKLAGIFLILSYGTLVKFQGRYVTPLFLVWIAYILSGKKTKKIFFLTLLKASIIFYSVIYLIAILGPKVKENHSWQDVKIFDLAAIGYDTEQDLFPQHFKKETYSKEKFINKFTHWQVDGLLLNEDSILKKTQNLDELNHLWDHWKDQVLKHPFLYIKHRIQSLSYAFFYSPGWFIYCVPMIQKYVALDHSNYSSIYWIIWTGAMILFAPGIPIILSFYYCYLGWRIRKISIHGLPLFFLNTTGLSMVIAIFFFSVGGTARYLYISTCFASVSHIFAYKCWKTLKLCKGKKSNEKSLLE